MMIDCLLQTAERYPDKIVAKDPARELSFARMLDFAKAIRRIVTKETDCPRVGIMLPTSVGGLGCIAGVLWAGRTIVPLNFLLQAVELERIIADAQIDLILGTVHFEELLSKLPVRTLYLERLHLKRQVLWSRLQSTPPAPKVSPDDTAAIVYTSATTGVAKGVCLSHRNLVGNAKAILDHMKIGPEDRLLSLLPNFHVFGLTVLNVIPLVCGPAISCLPRFSPQEMHRIIVEDKTTVVIAIPSMFAALGHLKQLSPEDFRHVKIAASGGEPLPRRVYEEVHERTGMRIIEGYGMTETSPIISADLPWAHRVGTVGPPLAGVEIQVRDTQGRPLPAGEEGELCVRGSLVMQGYYNRPVETAAVIDPDGWLRTGDIVRVDEANYIRITGRAKDLIIVGGENVYPREIEDVLERHPAVADCAVIGRKDGLRGEAVVGFVTLREGCSASGTDLRAFCRESLAGYKVPREVHIRPDLPRGPTGKILKRQLPALLEAQS